jgi:putative hydrolases of HD superfamily
MSDRLDRQMAFLTEIERLKVVYRRNHTIDRSRPESSAEHSWHVALMALILFEHAADDGMDVVKVLKMLLIHDLVEVYAGDTWLYDQDRVTDQEDRESQSAAQLFALLPDDQAAVLRQLWIEFESRSTAEARYAAAIDALQPLSNWLLAGSSDESDGRPSQSQVLERKRHIEDASEALWSLAKRVIAESTEKGFYAADTH